MDAIFVCDPGRVNPWGPECWNCGGWVHADGCVPKGEEPIAGHFCSIECHDEATAFEERQRAALVSDWCPDCGFDRHEHAAWCSKGDGRYVRVDGGSPCPTCRQPYRDHDVHVGFTEMGEEVWFRKLCGGSLGKL